MARLTIVRELTPRGPYTLARSARAPDATRRMDERGLLTAVVRTEAGPTVALAWQRADGRVVVRAADDEAVERIRFLLALDDDHSDFLRRFVHDPLIGQAVRRIRGLRPPRLDTVAQSLLRAFCGQLIDSRTARSIEARIVRSTTPFVPAARLYAAPTGRELAALAPAQLRRLGLHARRGAALVRVCGALDLERLHGLPTETVVRRLERERGLGPWSVGVVCLEGLGRREHGLVGDLGLVKLCSALWGRWVEIYETAELLAPYDEWAGLAGFYLMRGWAAGLVPGASADRARLVRCRAA